MIRGSAWRVVANGAGIVLGLGTARLLLGHLSVPESGQYVTVLSLVSIAVYVADIGLNVAGSRELALRGPQDRTLIANLLGQRLLVMPAAVALLVVFHFGRRALFPDFRHCTFTSEMSSSFRPS